MIVLGFKCRKYTSFLHKPLCKVVCYQIAWGSLSFVFHDPALTTYFIPPLRFQPAFGKDLSMWPLAPGRSWPLKCSDPHSTAVHPFPRDSISEEEGIFVFQTIFTISKISHWAWQCEIQYPLLKPREVGHWWTMAEMTFWFTGTASFPCFQRTSHITRKTAWAGLLERGQHRRANAANINPHSKLPK